MTVVYQRVRRASFPFCECDGDGELPQFQGSKTVQYFAALAANMGAFALGSVISWSSVALPSLRKEGVIKVTPSEESWIGSIMTIGAAVAGPVAGLSMENLGRRASMLLLTVPFLAGWLIIYFANDVTMILFGRFITGFCSGVYSSVAPIFTAEMADVSIRGTLCAGFDLMITVGILFTYIVGVIVDWRLQSLIAGVLPVIIFIMMLFVPESPRYLVHKGKTTQATKALVKFRGASSEADVTAELSALSISIKNSQEKWGGWKDLCKMNYFHPILIAFFIYFFQVFSGIDPVIFYTVDIFTNSGVPISGHICAIILGIIGMIAAICGAFLVDKYSRRVLLMISEAAMVMSLFLLGLYFHILEENPEKPPENLAWLPLFSLTVYITAYAIGIGPVGYMIMAEIIPHHAKGIAGSVLTSIKWLMSFVVTKFFGDFVTILGKSGCFWLFGGICLLGILYVLFFLPETKGKTLDEIQGMFCVPTGRRSTDVSVLTEQSSIANPSIAGEEDIDEPTLQEVDNDVALDRGDH